MNRDFDEIRPYETGEMRQAFEELLDDRQFNAVLKGFAPWLPKFLRKGLLRLAFTGVKTPLQFQKRFMKPVVKYIIRKYTDGCTFDDGSLQPPPNRGGSYETSPQLGGQRGARYTFVSNHRDIVLDSALLDVLLIDANAGTTCEIAIGDNLLAAQWIKDIVRINKSFIVERSLGIREMLAASKRLSEYMHYVIGVKHDNVWIAQ
ncbi:MAG: acyltransferase, partial [Prevotella sp.]|nr:acyltransferase [Prevotella sp.]